MSQNELSLKRMNIEIDSIESEIYDHSNTIKEYQQGDVRSKDEIIKEEITSLTAEFEQVKLIIISQ